MTRINKNKNTLFIALIGGIYLVLTLVFAPFSFGVIQIRLSEILTILACFSTLGVWGVTFGCFFSNLIGMFFLGVTVFDVVFGTIATLLAAILSYKFRNIKYKGLPVLSSLMPVFLNAFIIGPMLYFLTFKGNDIKILLFYILTVGLGELISASALGLSLYHIIIKHNISYIFDVDKK